MANWYGTARTNYVTITDMGALKDSVKDFDMEIHKHGEEDKHAFFPSEASDGDFLYSTIGLDDEEIEFTWEHNVMPFVKEEEVLVVICAGSEKSRYVTGSSEAYQRKGDKVSSIGVDLNSIYSKAASIFEVELQSITTATY